MICSSENIMAMGFRPVSRMQQRMQLGITPSLVEVHQPDTRHLHIHI